MFILKSVVFCISQFIILQTVKPGGVVHFTTDCDVVNLRENLSPGPRFEPGSLAC